MKIFTKSEVNRFPFILTETLYFDIETTGFINSNSHIYMIGMFYIENDVIKYYFLFAESLQEELNLLVEFKKILSKFRQVVTFNGDTFDIPYINWRSKVYGVNISFTDVHTIDMYKDFKKYKNFLQLDKLKQKYIEEFLGIFREDKYTGGELISIYKDYTITKSEYLEKIITLHNINDMEGMGIITNLYNYLLYDQWNFCNIIDDLNTLIFRFCSKYNFIKPHNIKHKHFDIKYYENYIDVILTKYESELKFYLSNYKDYYYLPNEDTAIHKSVGKFVDSSNRKQATKLTSYIKKYSNFVRLPYIVENAFFDDTPTKHCFIELKNISSINPYELIKNIMSKFK